MSEDAKKPEPQSKMGRFIQTYSGFLSTFVISAAGLIATSVWQYRQSIVTQQQAASQQQIAVTQAENQWKISRAEILAKNLEVLAAQGPTNVDQRYGVLLSLARGAILDPELAVSYALELGKDNANYMRSVLASTSNKDYVQLLQAFQLTCLQRYGAARDVGLCKNDKLSDRSDAIAELVADDLEAAAAQRQPGALVLLKDERQVQASLAKLAWLFEPHLTRIYQRRSLEEAQKFENASPGAKLVGALVFATSRTGEFVTADEATRLEQFQSSQRKALSDYIFGNSCDPECKGRIIDMTLSLYGESQGAFDDTIRKLLLRPRSESGPAIGRLHTRLLACQVDPADAMLFRDKVLVPALKDALAQPKTEPIVLRDIAGLLAVIPDPTTPTADWTTVLGDFKKSQPELYSKSFVSRRATATVERKDPPPALRQNMFCNAAAAAEAAPGIDK